MPVRSRSPGTSPTPAATLQTQFANVPHTRGPITGAPLIDGALGWLECTTYAVHDGGDHTILVGRVERASEIRLPGSR